MQKIDAFFFKDTLLHPTQQFNDDISKMYHVFCALHPPNGISNEIGVVSRCVKEFKKVFPSHHDDVLHLTAKMFTFERLREVNEKFTKKKKKKKTEDPEDSEVEDVVEVSEDEIPDLEIVPEEQKVTVFDNNQKSLNSILFRLYL